MDAVFKKNIEVVDSKPITFAGFPAYQYVVKAPQPQNILLKIIWFIKDDHAYTITLIAQMFRYDQYVGKFDEMLRSFAIAPY
jgi:hypothetical protein